jgi:hypothetical protein
MEPQTVRGIWCGPCKRDLFDEPEVWKHVRAHGTPLCFTEADGPFLDTPRPALPAITKDEVLDLVSLPASAWSLAGVL